MKLSSSDLRVQTICIPLQDVELWVKRKYKVPKDFQIINAFKLPCQHSLALDAISKEYPKLEHNVAYQSEYAWRKK